MKRKPKPKRIGATYRTTLKNPTGKHGARLRVSHQLTSQGQKDAQALARSRDLEGVKYSIWGPRKIKALYTDEYIADLLARAALNKPKRVALHDWQSGSETP